jgi:YHS domain-containing protein
MLRGLFRLVFYFFIFYVVYLVIRIYRGATRPRKEPEPPRQVQGVMVKDDVCNMYIPKETALREVRKGEEHFFCSEECRRKFHETPDPR